MIFIVDGQGKHEKEFHDRFVQNDYNNRKKLSPGIQSSIMKKNETLNFRNGLRLIDIVISKR